MFGSKLWCSTYGCLDASQKMHCIASGESASHRSNESTHCIHWHLLPWCMTSEDWRICVGSEGYTCDPTWQFECITSARGSCTVPPLHIWLWWTKVTDDVLAFTHGIRISAAKADEAANSEDSLDSHGSEGWLISGACQYVSICWYAAWKGGSPEEVRYKWGLIPVSNATSLPELLMMPCSALKYMFKGAPASAAVSETTDEWRPLVFHNSPIPQKVAKFGICHGIIN